MNNKLFNNLFKFWDENTETRKEGLKWKTIWFKRNLGYGKKKSIYICRYIWKIAAQIKFPEIKINKRTPFCFGKYIAVHMVFLDNRFGSCIAFCKVLLWKKRWNVLKSCRISNLSYALLIQTLFFVVFDFTTVRFHSILQFCVHLQNCGFLFLLWTHLWDAINKENLWYLFSSFTLFGHRKGRICLKYQNLFIRHCY